MRSSVSHPRTAKPPPVGRCRLVVLTSLQQTLPFGGFALLDPGLAQLCVFECFQGSCRSLRRFPGCSDVSPTAPTHRAVQAGQVKPHCFANVIGIDDCHRPRSLGGFWYLMGFSHDSHLVRRRQSFSQINCSKAKTCSWASAAPDHELSLVCLLTRARSRRSRNCWRRDDENLSACKRSTPSLSQCNRINLPSSGCYRHQLHPETNSAPALSADPRRCLRLLSPARRHGTLCRGWRFLIARPCGCDQTREGRAFFR